MLYTSVEKVKQHLVSVFPLNELVIDQPVILHDSDEATFFGGAVNEATFAVKSIQSNDLKKAEITLGNPETFLPDDALIRGTVVVASDSSLGVVYVENKDYVIDYSGGRLTIKSGGDLTAGEKVIIWYGNYFKYSADGDYIVDYSSGTIRRGANSDISAGETVFLDYSPVVQTYNDVIVQNAVDEANALIEATVDPNQEFGLEPVLQIAATYRAVEIVSRASAARELSSQRGEHNVALGWLKLADDFAARADILLQTFRAPYNGPSGPLKS